MSLDRANELKTSMLWSSVVEELSGRVSFEASRLRTCAPEDLMLIQARINIFETVMKLPEDVIEREE
jgi:hypothetical protein